MIKVQIPQDVSVYEATFLGPLTARQTVCFGVAIAVEYIYYNVVKYLQLAIDMNLFVMIGIILAVPILYMATGKPYGMKPELYIYNYLLPSLFAPKDRPYATKLTYDLVSEAIDKEANAITSKSENKGKKEKQKNKQPKKSKSRQDIMYA